LLLEQCCQGLNRIRLLSGFQVITSATTLILLALLTAAHKLTGATAVMASLAGTTAGSVFVVARLKPRFSGIKPYFSRVVRDLRGYGFNLYLARVTATSATLLDVPMVAYFLGRSWPETAAAIVGHYSWAQKLGSPISTMSRALAITRFRAFARQSAVPARISRWNGILLVAAAIGLVLAGPAGIRIVFPRFEAAIPLLLPFAVLNVFAGLFQPYNAFLASHGRGREVRNIAILVSVANLAGIGIALPLAGIRGAAWAGAAAMALDYILHVYYYRKFKRELGGDANPEGTDPQSKSV
jgi:O-antigen/teichoic acid export membrane protein